MNVILQVYMLCVYISQFIIEVMLLSLNIHEGLVAETEKAFSREAARRERGCATFWKSFR
jgi:hypothetical protein